MMSAFGRSSRITSALAVMLAFSSWPGFSIDTSTSKVVTLSFSTPIGEICVTLPVNTLSRKLSVVMRAGMPRRTKPMSASSTLPRTNTCCDVAQGHHQGGVGAEVEDRRHRAADLEVAGEHGAADRRLDGRVGQLLVGALGGRLGLRHLGARLLDLRAADQQLRLRGALAVHAPGRGWCAPGRAPPAR